MVLYTQTSKLIEVTNQFAGFYVNARKSLNTFHFHLLDRKIPEISVITRKFLKLVFFS